MVEFSVEKSWAMKKLVGKNSLNSYDKSFTPWDMFKIGGHDGIILRLQRGQSVQEYTTEFRRLVVALGISTNNEDVFTKHVAGLPLQIQNEMRLHVTTNISNASSIDMEIEQ